MQREDFTIESPGRLEPTTFTERVWNGSQWEAQDVMGVGFVPDPLPPKLDIPAFLFDLYPAIIEAERNLSELEGLGRRLGNPHLLTGIFSQREAILSSRIEDTFASVEDLALIDRLPSETEDRGSALEVRNYVRALHHGLRSDLPLCLRLIREMHSILMSDVRRPGVQPGEFRASQNAIGRGHSFGDAKFVPPPVKFMSIALNDLEQYLNAEDTHVPRLVRFAFVHYQFETIHPFADGNGRLGRLMIPLMLCKQGQLTQPLVYVSAFFEQHRTQYCDLLYDVSARGTWKPWTAFFLEAVSTQAQDALDRADKLLSLRDEFMRQVQEKRASALLPPLIDKLFEYPSITASEITSHFQCTPQTAWALIERLREKKIIQEITGRARNRVFAAPRLLDLIVS